MFLLQTVFQSEKKERNIDTNICTHGSEKTKKSRCIFCHNAKYDTKAEKSSVYERHEKYERKKCRVFVTETGEILFEGKSMYWKNGERVHSGIISKWNFRFSTSILVENRAQRSRFPQNVWILNLMLAFTMRTQRKKRYRLDDCSAKKNKMGIKFIPFSPSVVRSCTVEITFSSSSVLCL